jgi:transcription elongation GreA/GreB family factor
MDKTVLLKSIEDTLVGEFAQQTNAAEDAHKEATNDESRSEDRYDMRGQLAAYLAAGQAKLADGVANAIMAFRNIPIRVFAPGEPVAVGAVVRLETRSSKSVYFLGPAHGGLEVRVNGDKVMVVTPASPLGRSLMGRRTGERVGLPQGSRTIEHTIAAVE